MVARIFGSLAAAALCLGLVASAAQANVVNFQIQNVFARISCPNDGCALIPPTAGHPNPTTVNQGSAAELAYVNELLGTSFTANQVTQVITSGAGDQGVNMNIFGPYFWLKIDGPNAGSAYFSNTGGTQVVRYETTCPAGTDPGTCTNGGLSHYEQVPLPGAVLLFLSALGGLVGWRKWGGQNEATVPQMA